MTKSTVQKKPPTVPKPFKLSTSNCRRKGEEDTTPNVSQDRTPKATNSFRAKKLPKSHRVPFMVLHSTKNLTHPEEFSLKTNERSVSRHRSGSNKNDSATRDDANDPKSQYSCRSLSKGSSIKPIKTVKPIDKRLDMFKIDIDAIIKNSENPEL